MALAKMVGLEVTPRMPLGDELGQAPASQVVAPQVVEPGALALLCIEVVQLGHGLFLPVEAAPVARARVVVVLSALRRGCRR